MLEKKKALITGGGRGLGKEISKEFLRQGADICICARSLSELKDTARALQNDLCRQDQKIIFKKADISHPEEVDALFEYIMEQFNGLDILVNNAGIQGPIGKIEEIDWQELRKVIDINLLGTVYVSRMAIRVFKEKQTEGSVINISGGGATGARPFFLGYAIAKTGIVRATETMAKEAEPYGIRINAIAPGAMNTSMTAQIIDAGERAGVEYEKSLKQKLCGGASMENAAGLAAFLASDEAEGISGKLISAIWDDWKNLGAHPKELQGSDIYTLRRIIPEDRGFDWQQ